MEVLPPPKAVQYSSSFGYLASMCILPVYIACILNGGDVTLKGAKLVLRGKGY